jgi:hypothetical protein
MEKVMQSNQNRFMLADEVGMGNIKPTLYKVDLRRKL